jgi:hypothetical protein
VEEQAYYPGNIIKTVDVPQQQVINEENLEKFKFDVSSSMNISLLSYIIISYFGFSQRQVRRLLAEGRISSYEKGEMVVQLQNLEFQEDEALVAVEQCDDIYSATKFLRQECELCANTMNVKEV